MEKKLEKSRRLDDTETSVRIHQLKLVGRTRKEEKWAWKKENDTDKERK